ncbi:hypothetical protein NWT09_14115 [Mycolicibacterium sp. jd]|uniref:hypothetical protein n=1 Tax=unclassified Mycolicibacterium TaxID=2636767 RepID=UPI00351B3295
MATATVTTPNLKEAVLDHIPGYRRAENRHKRLQKLIRIVPNETELKRDYRARIFAAADADVDSLDDLRQDYITDRAIWQGAAAFAEQVSQALRQASEDMKTARLTGSRAALDYLRTQLDDLMAEVREHRDIIATHPKSAEHVINAGNAAQKNWNLVEGLISRYDELRAAHRDYVRIQTDGSAGQDFATCGQIATFIDHDPSWLYRRGTAPGSQSQVEEIRAWFNASRGRVKPADVNRVDIWPQSYRASQWLLIVADNQPWLPDGTTIKRSAQTANQLMDQQFRDASRLNLFRSTVAELDSRLASGKQAKVSVTAFNEDLD